MNNEPLLERIIRVNLNKKSVSVENVPSEYELIGGRGLTAKILLKETPPLCDPLGRENKIVICPGPLAGTMAPSFGRISVGGKSPLTNGIKEANAGGPAGQKLGKLGIKAIIIEGALDREVPYFLKISPGMITLFPASTLRGKGNYDVVKELQLQFGNRVSIMSIGPCGEMQMSAASIAFTDVEGRPCRQAARGGLGAVMGSKGLKAIVIDDAHMPKVDSKNPEAFRKAIKFLIKALQGDRGVPSYRFSYGTPGALNFLNTLGALPTRNFREGSFTEAEKISGETLKELNQTRGGKMHGCMPGCIVKCSIIFHNKDHKYLTAALEFETIALMGSNLCIDDLDTIAEISDICNDLGLDTIEVGNALGLAMEAGLLAFGDRSGTIELLKEIGKGTDRGKVLGNGAVTTGNFFNIKRIAHARGQGLPAHDPRVSKPAGVTFCTSPMGGDHTAGVDYSSNPMDSGTSVEKSKRAQIIAALADTLGYCLLAIPIERQTIIEHFVRILNAHFNKNLSSKDLFQVGQQVIKDELAFNEAAGFPSNGIYLADFLTEEPLPPTGCTFDVDKDKIKKVWET
jgi:aldehyde:ferredoxin oxidoreductase